MTDDEKLEIVEAVVAEHRRRVRAIVREGLIVAAVLLVVTAAALAYAVWRLFH